MIGIAAARSAGASRYLRRKGWVCPRCGKSQHRVIRGECQGCRALKRPLLEIVRQAAWRAIGGRPLNGLMEYSIGASDRVFRAWLVAECERNGFKLGDYGKTWQVYHRRELRTFDLLKNSDRVQANQLGNLEVREKHNRQKGDGL